MVWIPFTIVVWQLTREWLPERFGGWAWLLAAHLPVFAVVTVIHTFVMVLLSAALADSADGAMGELSHAAARTVECAAADLHGDRRHRAPR